jgi:acetyl-CoA carboxylase biotin carboxylase subunit
MGSKAAARTLAQSTGVPVVPGSDGPLESIRQAEQLAQQVGYPVLLKASAGGGGRGMRQVEQPQDLERAYREAQAEAMACFGNGEMYLEKLVRNPRHIEFQIMADNHGHVVHLGERDCSIQRRRQKIVEESPSKALSPQLREEMGRAAVAAARAAGYVGAGTVEFVLAPDGRFYFIEMNTRIQVEHPVTELVTGIDLVKEQLRVAAGLPLSFRQEDVKVSGHAIECRINAEDPEQGFRPCPGKTEFLHLPGGPGVRVDTALYSGYEVPPYYDSLVAKVLVHAATRLEAIRRMRRSLEELVIEGYPTNAVLAHLIMHDPEFVRGQYDTGFLDQNLEKLLKLARTCDELISETAGAASGKQARKKL